MSNLCPCTLGNSVAKALFNLRDAKKGNSTEPEQTAQATLLSRQVKHANTVYNECPWLFLATFRLENGEELELQTTEELFGTLKENTAGTLVWQENTLVSFIAE